MRARLLQALFRWDAVAGASAVITALGAITTMQMLALSKTEWRAKKAAALAASQAELTAIRVEQAAGLTAIRVEQAAMGASQAAWRDDLKELKLDIKQLAAELKLDIKQLAAAAAATDVKCAALVAGAFVASLAYVVTKLQG